MARVAYVDVPPNLQYKFGKMFTPLYKTKNSSLRWSGGLVSPRKKYLVSSRSLLPQIKEAWAGLDATAKAAWTAAGAQQGYSGYNLFVQDTTYRIKYGLEGLSTPSIYHAYKCGQILMEAPATHFAIEQLHPIEYYKMRKVRGTKSQYVPVPVSEVLHLPLTIGLSYRTNLTAAGPSPIVRFYARIVYSYQGTDKIEELTIPIPLTTEWTRASATCSRVVGIPRWYSLIVELADVQGVLQFDAVQSYHTGTNFAREFRCNNIAAGFSNLNYQVPPSWAATAPVTGAHFGSVYPAETL